MTALTDRKGPDTNPSVSPDGRWIAYTGFDDKRFTSHVSSLYLMDKTGGAKRIWAGALNDSPSNVNWAADNSGVYFQVRELGSTSHLLLPVAGGAPRKLTGGTQVLNGLSVAQPRAGGHRPLHAARARLRRHLRHHHPSAMKKLVDVNADVLEGRALGQVEEMWFDVEGRPQSAGLAGEARRLPAREEVPDGAVDSWRPVVDVRRRLQLELPELRRPGLRGALHQPARQHGLRPGLRERHPVFVSRARTTTT